MLIKKTLLILTLSIFSVHSYAASADNSAGDRTTPPNILLIISDDFGMDVTSDMYPGLIDGLMETYGPDGFNHPNYSDIDGKPASTPRLDQLASEGMIFTNFWAQPFCSATRASLLTGLFAANTKVTSYVDPLSQNHTSFVQKLRDEGGYSTALFGKWHLAGLPGEPVDYPGIKPKEAGFDLFQGNLHAAITTYWSYDYQIQNGETPANTWQVGTPPEKALEGIAPTTFAPVVKAADTIEWITAQEQTEPEKPWFAWLAFNLSHATSVQVPSAMAVPNADTLDASSYTEMQACGGEFGTANTGTCSGEELMRAMTNAMDTIVGKVLDAVEQLDPNTYIIYISDNGTPMYARPELDFIDNMYLSKTGRGKGTAYESGARVAMTISGPGIGVNSESEEFVHVADLFSTTLGLAGLAVPEQVSNSDGNGEVELDAVSLTPILFGDSIAVRDPNNDYLLTETLNLMTEGTRQVGARNETYKLICTDGSDIKDCEFYNLQADPLEEYLLANPESCANYRSGVWSYEDQQWHYCRLNDVIKTRSFFSL